MSEKKAVAKKATSKKTVAKIVKTPKQIRSEKKAELNEKAAIERSERLIGDQIAATQGILVEAAQKANLSLPTGLIARFISPYDVKKLKLDKPVMLIVVEEK